MNIKQGEDSDKPGIRYQPMQGAKNENTRLNPKFCTIWSIIASFDT